MTVYLATGSVRGDCGHEHRTAIAAFDCAEADKAAIRRLPSSPYGSPYSDRHVEAVEDGEQRPLTDVEFAAMVGQLERREGRAAR
jgi:hypothetical protein